MPMSLGLVLLKMLPLGLNVSEPRTRLQKGQPSDRTCSLQHPLGVVLRSLGLLVRSVSSSLVSQLRLEVVGWLMQRRMWAQ
jgi:hypothetical protein